MSDAHGHDHGDGHDHAHDHHDHARELAAMGESGRRRLKVALAITAVFMCAEAAGGWVANSAALLADAGHMLADAGSLALSLLAIHFAARPATAQKSYGWRRLEILAALANGVTLVLISLGIFAEAIERLGAPPVVDLRILIGVGALGLVSNLASARVLHGGAGGHDVNVRSAYVHVLSDVLGAAGAVVGGLVMWRTGWYAADPLIAALVGLLVLRSAWGIVKQAADILLEGVPAHVDLGALERELGGIEGVRGVHDLHVWTISSGVHVLTCHAVVGAHGDHHELLERLSCRVRERCGIHHSTIQLECEDLSPREAAGGCRRSMT